MERARAIAGSARRTAGLAGALGLCLSACGGSESMGPPTGSSSVRIVSGPTALRQGDVAGYGAEASGSAAGQPISWSVVPTSAGLIQASGRFVGYAVGTLRIVAQAGSASDTLELEVEPRDVQTGEFRVVGRGEVRERFTSDLWLHGDVAYTGTWGLRANPEPLFGDRLYAWDVRSPSAPLLTDSVGVDARTVNDVKIRADGALAVLTHEGDTEAADGFNGITLLDLTDPFHPVPLARYTEGLELGVHNVWIEGDHVYAVVDGTQPGSGSGLAVIDISEPAEPTTVATFWGGGTGLTNFLHDVYVRDGLAFLSHWDAGLVILDVGNGIAGGQPSSPVEVGRVPIEGGHTHNAWYWPETGYVFVGDEYGTRRAMHVVDASDPADPREVATYDVPGETPHNFWLDEERAILYMAWYTQGLIAIDASGELMGELHRQGREVASIRYDGTSGCRNQTGGGTCTWAPQLQDGHVFVSDMNSGLWALRLEF